MSLGVRLDTKLTFWKQIKSTSDLGVTSALSKYWRPKSNRQKLLMPVIRSILLYGSEIWADALKLDEYRRRMVTLQKE